jgi:hypothetical protein
MPDDNTPAFLAGLRVEESGDKLSVIVSDDETLVAKLSSPGHSAQTEAIVTACHEYAARHRDQTHSDGCWRLPGHETCAQRLLAQWWPVIEEAKKRGAREWGALADSLSDTWWSSDAEDVCRAIAAALKEGKRRWLSR